MALQSSTMSESILEIADETPKEGMQQPGKIGRLTDLLSQIKI
jgi:hypothetical protein